MKRPQKQWTPEDARRFMIAGGEAEPTPELTQLTRRLLEICDELGVGFSEWNERLYPKLDDLIDCQVFTAVEKVYGMQISDAVYEETHARTFGDLVHFYHRQFTFISARCVHEKAKLTNAHCATQTAFYLLRRRLSDAGVTYHQAHDLKPNALDFQLTEKQVAHFVDSLRYELGLSLWFDRIIGKNTRTGDLVTAFLFATAFAIAAVIALCTDLVSGSMLWGGLLGFVVWALLGTAFSRVLNRRAHFRFYRNRREYQTLGDVARDFANIVQAPPQAQTV